MSFNITKAAAMINPQKFNAYVALKTTELSRFRNSGIIADFSNELGPMMGGTTVHMPHFNPLDSTDDDDVIDDSQDISVSSITTGMDVAAKLFRAKGFGATDLAHYISGEDVMAGIGLGMGAYWASREQRLLLAVLQGAMGSAGMENNVLDISTMAGAAANFDHLSFIDACGRLGDHASQIVAIACHSDVVREMEKDDDIQLKMPSVESPNVGILQPVKTYKNRIVIEDDGMPVSGAGANKVYTTYLFGPGAIGYVGQTPFGEAPIEPFRHPGKNGGQTEIYHKRLMCMHPRGIKWKGASALSTPSNTELANPGNWERVFDPKLIRVVQFKHKLFAS
jgi:hypothetical protein